MPVFTKRCVLFVSFVCAIGTGAIAAAAPAPLAISHRACMYECPENTLPAIAWAAETGADVIEIDLRATRDGQLVVIHDKTVNRTTNGRGQVKELTLAEISQLDAGEGERIPTMDEAFAFIRTTELGVLLDLKDVKGIEPAEVYAALVRHELQQRVVIGARSVKQLRAFKALDSTLATMAFTRSVGLIPRYVEHGVDIVRLWARWVNANPALVDKVREGGKEVWVTSGALRGAELAGLMQKDIQGFITDYPGDVVQQRAKTASTKTAVASRLLSTR